MTEKRSLIVMIALLGIFATLATAEASRERGELIAPKSDAWLEWTSVEDILEHRPERIDTLLKALDLEREELEKVKAALERGDKAAACHALLDYYAGPGRKAWAYKDVGEPGEKQQDRADNVLARRVPGHDGVVGIVPRVHGGWDWGHRGPSDDPQYAYLLNRHPFLTSLYQTWRATGEAKYAEAFDRIIRDWVLHAGYSKFDHGHANNLNAAFRMKGWPIAFYGFLDSPHFTEAGRLLMLASIMVHGEALDRVGGWRRPEFDALFRVGAGFPEFEASSRWEHHAMQRMLKTFRRQVYPDGAYDELSPHYHMVAINRFEGFAQFAEQAGRELPPDLGEGLEAMHTYYAGLIRPDGSMPQLNRADRDRPTQLLLGAAERYDRPDWRYMATAGREGTRPADPPSRFFPWAGHLVSRDGWGEQALWSIFNAGPEGSRSVYADALHLSVSAFGKDFLLNSGRFWYKSVTVGSGSPNPAPAATSSKSTAAGSRSAPPALTVPARGSTGPSRTPSISPARPIGISKGSKAKPPTPARSCSFAKSARGSWSTASPRTARGESHPCGTSTPTAKSPGGTRGSSGPSTPKARTSSFFRSARSRGTCRWSAGGRRRPYRAGTARTTGSGSRIRWPSSTAASRVTRSWRG